MIAQTTTPITMDNIIGATVYTMESGFGNVQSAYSFDGKVDEIVVAWDNGRTSGFMGLNEVTVTRPGD